MKTVKKLLRGNARLPGPGDLAGLVIVLLMDASPEQISDQSGNSLFDSIWNIPFYEEITSSQPKIDVQIPVGGWSGELRVTEGGREANWGIHDWNRREKRIFSRATITSASELSIHLILRQPFDINCQEKPEFLLKFMI